MVAMSCVILLLASIIFYICIIAEASNVVIRGTHTWSRYAQIEAEEVSIQWVDAMPPMPVETASFANASKLGLWSSSLDGPGDSAFQTLLVRPLSPSES